MNARGTTLAEVLVALALLGIGASTTLSAFVVQLHANTRYEHLASAISAAEMEMEDLRMQNPELMPTTGSSSPRLVLVGDLSFEVVTHYCERSDLCPTATTRYVRVQVQYQGSDIYDVEAIFTLLR